MEPVIARALEQQESVLSDGTERWVLMLDGRTVRSRRGSQRSDASHSTERAARDAFVAAIEAALEAGFGPEHRDPPRPGVRPPAADAAPAVEQVQAEAAPAVEHVHAAARPAAVGVSDPAAQGALPRAWAFQAPRLSVAFDWDEDARWEQLARAPSGATELEVIIGTDAPAVFEVVRAVGLPEWARGLSLASYEVLEDFIAAALDAAELWPHFGALRRLELRAGRIHLPPRALPRLKHLELWCADTDPSMLAALVAQPWPELRSLRLWLARVDQPGVPGCAVLPLFDRERFPKLTSLGVHALSEADELAGALASSTLGPGLTTWVIDGARGRGSLPDPDGIELSATGEFFPLRSAAPR